ncbi:flavin-containing monooxygenase [Nocardioides sp. NPDC051685]|uniref:flavin-containing monooxygenase n=1 Tax=Nocardioides sp. NPDC051685 TaxID=3364334 RepID=UPI0037AE6B0C
MTAAVIGGGFSGIAAAIALRKQGCQVTLFEKSSSVGGTWWDNTYPGAEVDTPSVLYSFSYAPWRWSRTHVRQAELLDYLQRVTERFGLSESLRLGVTVERVEWIDTAQCWEITLTDGSISRHQIVVSAVGFLSQPKYPDWPGLEEFGGRVVHTARWESDLPIEGRKIAVVGSGSTAAQVVPGLADMGAELLMFQREPGWVLPKGARPYTDEERWALNSSIAQRISRYLMLYRREKSQYRNAAWRPGTPQNEAAESAARKYIGTVFADRPDLAEAVTPSYPFGGKRPVLADGLYPAMLKDNLTLVPHAVERVTRDGVVDKRGVEHKIESLVLATGFHTDFHTNFDVVGPHGTKLADAWGEEPEAMLGIMVPGFPNFFIMYGPNTNGGAIVTHLEAQASYIGAAARALGRRGATRIEVKERPVKMFNAWLQRRLEGTSFEGANNYYKSPSGRVITQWSDGAIIYTLMTRLLRRGTWRFGRTLESAQPDENAGRQ